MPIQSSGIGSGLDINGIISKLMEIERKPIYALDKKQSAIEAKISAYGSLKSKVADFQTAMQKLSSVASFKLFQATPQDETVLTASASSTAAPGSYAINITSLAERDKVASKAYTDANAVVGQGTLTLSVGGNSFQLTIDSSNNTVTGIRDAINNATNNTGVTASIVTDVNGAHLVLASDKTGVANNLTVTVAGDSDGNNTDNAGLSALTYDTASGITNSTAITVASDATAVVDGFNVTSSSNTFANVLDGVSFTAKAVGSTTLDVTRDDAAIKDAVNQFVDSYNALRTEIKNRRQGDLQGDNTLLSIERQMNDILNAGSAITGSSFSYLVQIGISIDKNGVMSVDDTTLSDVMKSDFNSFVNTFTAADGFANRFASFATNLLATDGLLDAKSSGLQISSDAIADQKLKIEDRLVSVERRLRAQFTAMDTLVASLSATGNYLTQQLAQISKIK